MENFIVIGASGLVGYEFYRQKKYTPDSTSWKYTYRNVAVEPSERSFIKLNANSPKEVNSLFKKLKPETVILTAAMAWVAADGASAR